MAPTLLLGVVLAQQAAAPPPTDPSPQVVELQKQLRDQDADIRMEAATSLGHLKQEARSAVPALAEALGDAAPAVRMKAADALGQIGGLASPAVPALLGALQDPDTLVRVSAAYALPRVGGDPKPIVTALKGALKDPERAVRWAASLALTGLRAVDPDVIAALREGLGDERIELRLQACFLLAENLPPGERSALLPLVLDSLRSREPSVRGLAVAALSAFGPEGVGALVATLEDEQEAVEVRQKALESLARLGPDARAAAPALKKLVDQRGRWVRPAQTTLFLVDGPPSPLPSPSPGTPSPNP